MVVDIANQLLLMFRCQNCVNCSTDIQGDQLHIYVYVAHTINKVMMKCFLIKKIYITDLISMNKECKIF